MSITSPRLTASLCTLMLPRVSCQELDPFGADHLVNASCITNAGCTAPTPVCDRTRSMCVPCAAVSDSGPATLAGTGNVVGDGVPRPQGAGRDMGAYENQ